MSKTWKTVRVFISSTFRDMHSERDHLVRVVFPELREQCARRNLHLVDVDLRWGVTEQDAERGKALEVCLREIEDCRPFFVGILGERYGWVPPSYDVPDEEDFDWVRQTEPGHSITAMEIYHGVLNNPEMRSHAFFYFRDPAFIDSLPEDQREDFTAEDAQSEEKLQELKGRISSSKLPVLDGYRHDDLDAFGRRVLEDLWTAIQAKYPEDAPEPDPLDAERAYHDFFIETRTELFIGQRHLLARLHEHAAGDAPGPMVVTGTPGCGKSALLAQFVDQFRRLEPETFILYHFIGTSPTSTDPRRMLLRLCQELARRFEIDDEIPEDYAHLRVAFWRMLQRVGEEHRMVLVIDALNQLDETHRSHELDWLPALVPAGLRLIVSSLEGDTLDAARRKYREHRDMLVTSLRLVDQGFIIARQLKAARKSLSTARNYRQWRAERIARGQDVPPEEDRSQLRYILTGVYSRQDEATARQTIERETANPLYLKLVAEELRLFGRFDRLEQFIVGLPIDVPGMFGAVLDRLEADHGERLVKRSLALIGTGRHGLLEGELLELLARPGEERFPMALWSRLCRNLAFYMKPRSSVGGGEEGLIDFFHRQLAKVIHDRYLHDVRVPRACHRVLAAYFRRKSDPGNDSTWRGSYLRGLRELPYHHVRGRQWPDLESVLTDLRFVEAKCSAGMTHGLVADCRAALAEFPEDPDDEGCKQGPSEEEVVKYVEALVRYAAKWGDACERHGRHPARHPLPNPDSIPLPESISSCLPRSEQEIAANLRRMVEMPAPLDRLRAFFQFVYSQSDALGNFAGVEGFCAQQAYNFADSGPVASAAEGQLASPNLRRPLLLHASQQRRRWNPFPALVGVLAGPSHSLSTIAITPDARKAVTGDYGGEIHIWDLTTGSCMDILSGHEASVCQLDITPDGRWAISVDADKTLRFWDLSARRCCRIVERCAAAMTPDGRVVFFGSKKDGFSFRVWDLRTGECLRNFKDDTDDLLSVALAPNGRLAVLHSTDKTLRIWDLYHGRQTHVIAHRLLSPHVAMSISGCTITCGDKSKRFWVLQLPPEGRLEDSLVAAEGIWDTVAAGLDQQTAALDQPNATDLSDHELPMRMEVYRYLPHDGGTVVAVSGGAESQPLRVEGWVSRTSDWVSAVAMTPDGRFAVTGMEDGSLASWDLVRKTCVRAHTGHPGAVRQVKLTADGRTAVSLSYDNAIRVWNLFSGIASQEPNVTDAVDRSVLTPDARIRLVPTTMSKTRSTDGKETWRIKHKITIVNARTDRILRSFKAESWWVRITPDGRTAIWEEGKKAHDNTIQEDTGYLRLGDIETGQSLLAMLGTQVIARLPNPSNDRIFPVAVTSDGCLTISGGRDRSLRICNICTGDCVTEVLDFSAPVTAVENTPDGRTVLASGSSSVGSAAGHGIRLVELKKGRCRKELTGHTGEITAVAIRPDGCTAVSGSKDRTVRLWDLTTGICLAIYSASSRVVSISPFHNMSEFAYSTADGNSGVLTLHNIEPAVPRTTAQRMWLYEKHGSQGAWDEGFSAWCPWCARRFVVDNAVLAAIASIARGTRLCQGQSPCLRLPDEAWDDPGLNAECPRCHGALKFNPFVVDNPLRTVRPGEAIQYHSPAPHPDADADLAMRLNLAYQEALKEWKALPFWKRWFRAPPEYPKGT